MYEKYFPQNGSGVWLHLTDAASHPVKLTRCLLFQQVRGCSVVTVETFDPCWLKWQCAIYTEPPADNLTTSLDLIQFHLSQAVSEMF